MANISDVAKKANVSVATVSRYLNESGYVGEKSRLSIEAAIKELDYIPSEVARTLSTKQSDLIGLMIPDIKNPFFPELARAVEDTAFKYGYTVILCNSDENAQKEQHYLQTLTQKYVAGILLTSIIDNRKYTSDLNIPIVALDRPIQSEIPTVTTDNQKGTKIGTEFLLTKGATSILVLSGPYTLSSTQLRLEGFLQAIEGKDIETKIIECHYDFEKAEKITFEFLKENPQIDSIFAFSDASAIGALKAAQRLGRKIPEQLQIIGFDGIEIGQVVTPSLTTVSQNIYKLGETATEMLIDMIEGKKLTYISKYIDPQLEIRETTRREPKE